MNNEQTSTAQRLEPRFGPARELDLTARNVRDVDAALPAPNMGMVDGLAPSKSTERATPASTWSSTA